MAYRSSKTWPRIHHIYAVNRPRTNSPLLPPFVGIAVLKRRPTILWLYVLQLQACLSLGFVLSLVLKHLLGKIYLRCLRFWFGGNLERELGQVFFPPQFTVRESEVSSGEFFCMCHICRWQAVPSFFFFSFFVVLEGLPLIGMGLACLCHPTFF